METISEALGRPLAFPDGYKPNLKNEGMKKYTGSPRFNELENWLATVAYRYAMMRFGGGDPDTDHIRVLSLMDYLEGDALTWYTTHVLSAKRSVHHWTFCDVIIGLYDRYILPTSMQDARENFRKVRYTVALGIQGYYDALLEQAQNMAVYPDDYTLLEEFVRGLPQTMLSRCFREHRITVEANSLEDWVAAAREIERCDRNESYYRDISKNRAQPPSNSKEGNATTRKGPRWGLNKPQSKGSGNVGIVDRTAEGTQQPTSGRVFDDRSRPRAASGRPPERPKNPQQTMRAFDKSKATGPKSVSCFICGGGHFANQCEQKGGKREFVRAAHTIVGDNGEDADDEGEERGQTPEDEEFHGPDGEENPNDDSDNAEHVIEVSGEEFYEGLSPYSEYVMSLHAFPLAELGKMRTNTEIAVKSPTTEQKGRMVEIDQEGKAEPSQPPNKKYRFRYSGKTRLRPATTPEEKECLTTWVSIGDLDAWTLWDSGSTTTGITPAFAELAKVKVDTLEDPHVLQLGTVGSRSIIKYGAEVEMKVANIVATSYVDIANFDRYDMIIGTPWMRKHGVVLDFVNNCVIAGGTPLQAIKTKEKDVDPRARCYRSTDKRRDE